MTSLRVRLFVMLAATTLLVWSAAAAWIAIHTRGEVQRVLDRRLVEAAGMVASLAEDTSAVGPRQQSRIIPIPRYTRQLSCQIWTLDGRLIGRSSGAPTQPLASTGSGMSERVIGGETWRVYSIVDARNGIRVSVGDNLRVRQRLTRDVMAGLILPAVAGLVALAFLIWAAVETGLRPLKQITRRLQVREPTDFSPIAIPQPTDEVRPLIEAIDARSKALAQLHATEREFIANAAHELQTPLAGLKTYVQIARKASDRDVRDRSLASIELAVDRSSRMVQQLLDLAREEAREPTTNTERVCLSDVIGAIREEFEPLLKRNAITVELTNEAQQFVLRAERTQISVALKNLIKNAIDHAPPGSTVSVGIERKADEVGVTVRDSGPGIPIGELGSVRERFVRGSRPGSTGSGLGLSIVELIMTRMNAHLELTNMQTAGLQAGIWMRGDESQLE